MYTPQLAAAIASFSFINLDLLSVGIAIAAIGLLGFAIYSNNPTSMTNRAFFMFAVITICWSTVNYVNYQVTDPLLVLWLFRFVIFFAVWYTFTFFRFLYIFPEEKKEFPTWYRFVVFPWVVLIAILTLSPYVFSGISKLSSAGSVSETVVRWGMAPFAGTVIVLAVLAFALFIRKMIKTPVGERKAYALILTGAVLTLSLLIVFNMILPGIFYIVQYIPLGALFTLPFVAFTAYAVYKHHLFNLKISTTALLGFMVTVFTFVNILYSSQLSGVIINVTAFLIVLLGSIKIVQDTLNLEKLTEKLEVSNEQLSEFMSLATHEIRNPATYIKGFTASALEGDLGELAPMVKDGMQKIFVRANDIIHLGNQYLDKSKLELNQIKYEFAPVDMGRMVMDLTREFQAAAVQAGITVITTIDKEGEYIAQADGGKMKETIGNLLDNAIKYTPKGSVTVSASKDDSKVTIKIADTGVGIPTETIPHLFQKFSRADAQKVNILGTGLGLFLAKTFVDAHHGRVWVESEGKDKGSTFFIELPVPPASNQVTS